MHHKNHYIYLATVLYNFKFQLYQRIYWFLKIIKKRTKLYEYNIVEKRFNIQ